jgi:hypothetical protein
MRCRHLKIAKISDAMKLPWKKKKIEKRVLEDFSSYIEPLNILKTSLDEQLKVDVYPDMRTDLIYSPDYLGIEWNTKGISIPIFEGMLTADGKENLYLEKGVVCAKGNLKVDTEYNALDSKKSSRARSPLYVMSVDRLKKLVVETRSHLLKEKYVQSDTRRTVRPESKEEVWPYIIREFLDYRFNSSSVYVEGKEVRLELAEINALNILREVNTKRPSVTVLRTRKPDTFENFSIAKPSSIDPNKAPLTISGSYEINFRPYEKNGKRLIKKGKGNTLHLFPDEDYVLPSIPIPAKISKPGPETEILPSNRTEKTEIYLRGDEKETYKRQVDRLELYPAPLSYIEIGDIGKYSFKVKEKRYGITEHSIKDLEDLAAIPCGILLTDWPLWLAAVGFLIDVPHGLLSMFPKPENFFNPIFNVKNILSPGDAFLTLETLWNYASIGFSLIVGLGGAITGETTYHSKKEVTKEGDGLMRLKVIYREHLPTLEQMKKTIDMTPREEESVDVKNWAEEKRIK